MTAMLSTRRYECLIAACTGKPEVPSTLFLYLLSCYRTHKTSNLKACSFSVRRGPDLP